MDTPDTQDVNVPGNVPEVTAMSEKTDDFTKSQLSAREVFLQYYSGFIPFIISMGLLGSGLSAGILPSRFTLNTFPLYVVVL